MINYCKGLKNQNVQKNEINYNKLIDNIIHFEKRCHHVGNELSEK